LEKDAHTAKSSKEEEKFTLSARQIQSTIRDKANESQFVKMNEMNEMNEISKERRMQKSIFKEGD